MGLLEGKRILVTGVLTDASIGFHVARIAREQGARIMVTAYPRPSLTALYVKRLPGGTDDPPPVIELDVMNTEHLDGLADQVRAHLGGLDGILHAIGFAPPSALGGNFLYTPWEDVATTLHVSAYSLKAITMACLPLMDDGGAVVGLDFDAARAWPAYDWMGVAKAGLESCARYLARYLGPHGIRVNLVAAGPLVTTAAKSIPGFEEFTGLWPRTAPLGWDVRDSEPTARACIALLSDWFPATTGEIVHVDGGLNAVGAPPADAAGDPAATAA
jgi:meromycolic acid enoyl-[acyl-carrier protein] reductase